MFVDRSFLFTVSVFLVKGVVLIARMVRFDFSLYCVRVDCSRICSGCYGEAGFDLVLGWLLGKSLEKRVNPTLRTCRRRKLSPRVFSFVRFARLVNVITFLAAADDLIVAYRRT